ncbi:MAG: hypothetical protein JW762_10415 [Dehalococcoidales bacterium]|nr:hypothetical protein [Dehalococcoidales bacterium]
MFRSILIVLVGIVVLVVSLGMIFDWIPILTEVIRTALGNFFSTVSSLFIIVYGSYQIAPAPIQSLVAKILRKISHLPNYYKRTTIKFELESEINQALKEFGKEGAGFIIEEVVIKWLTPGEKSRRLFFQSGKAYLKLDFEEDKEVNLVEAVMMHCNECLLMETRQYIDKPLMRAIDMTFVDELLNKRNAVRGRAYFTQEVIPRELKEIEGVDKYLNTLELLSQHGIFTRIFLPELKDYPGRTQRGVSRKNHLQQIEEFIRFLQDAAEDRTRINKSAWLHIGETIRIGVILVGLVDKLAFEGTKPYVRRVAIDNSKGARNVYLVGYNYGCQFVPRIAKEAKQRNICDKYEISEYNALIGREVKSQMLARLTIPEGSGAKFIEKYPNMNEWPDLEEETILSEIKEKEGIKPSLPIEKWEEQIHEAWLKRASNKGDYIPGSIASDDIKKVFGIERLRDGKYKTTQQVINNSAYLSERWMRDKENNRVIRI